MRMSGILRVRPVYACCQSALIALALVALPFRLQAQDVPVRYKAGSEHGYLLLRNLDGAILANGEVTQVPYHDQINLHLVFHFLDGSIDDETTVYSQRKTLRLISERHIQTGKSFPRRAT